MLQLCCTLKCSAPKLHAAVTFAALVLLQRLKARVLSARRLSGHRLFISAYPQPHSKNDPYHGQEPLAELASRFITLLFSCPDCPQASSQSQAKLPYFIAYALHRTKLHAAVTFAALVLLQRLKARFPSARGSSGHRLFISAYMISSKVMCDDTYSNKSWCIVAQGMFTLREVNQMEGEMCTYLDWELTVDDLILSNFEKAVKEDIREAKDRRTYPNYPTTFVGRQSRGVNFEHTFRRKIAYDKLSTRLRPTQFAVHGQTARRTGDAHESPLGCRSQHSANTASPTFSNTTSPTSSGSPATPVGGPETNPKIRGVDTSSRLTEGVHVTHPLKPKMFAFTVPSGW